MGETTAISWTTHTFNTHWGCDKVSPACDFCYAETLSKRWGFDIWGKDADRRMLSEKHWADPVKWDAAAREAGENRLVFCASMADVFEDRRDLDPVRARLWELIVSTPNLTWQLLTKRPQHVLDMVPKHWRQASVEESAPVSGSLTATRGRTSTTHPCWPANCWIGTTIEDQPHANIRVPRLLEIPAPVRFLSAEPLLGKVVLRPEWLLPEARVCARNVVSGPESQTALAALLRAAGERMGWRGVSWVIVGGESGPKRRELDLDHVRSLRAQCAETGVPFFMKQDSGMQPGKQGRIEDALWVHEIPAH